MKRSVVVVLTLAGLLGAEAPVMAQRGFFGEQEASRNGWLFSLSAGKQLARTTGKPLLVVLRCVP